jgi:predicted ATPase
LLERLLGVITSYSQDRQIVISTHSPYVLRWCDPADLRLVERVDDTTNVRSLEPAEVDRVEAYLRDEGTLDSFIFDHSDEE